MARPKKPTVVDLGDSTAPPELVGYARVSTQEQTLDLQIEALKRFGCKRIFEEKASASGKQKRYQLDLLMKYLEPGDTLVVWRLDRFARSMDEFYSRMKQLTGYGAKFKSITEDFDFSTAMGEFVLIILAAVAQLERQLTVHRTKAGLDTARAKGKTLGATAKINDAMMLRIQKKAALTGKRKMTMAQIAKTEGIAESSIFGRFKGGREKVLKWKPAKKPAHK